MTVRLATQVLFLKFLFTTWVISKRQVLSSSVKNALKTLRIHGYMKDTEETEKFCLMFDRFFDMLNTRAIDEGLRRKKPDLKPYEKADDERFQVNLCMYVCFKIKSDSGLKKHFWVTLMTGKNM